jgi:hypothetical protein
MDARLPGRRKARPVTVLESQATDLILDRFVQGADDVAADCADHVTTAVAPSRVRMLHGFDRGPVDRIAGIAKSVRRHFLQAYLLRASTWAARSRSFLATLAASSPILTSATQYACLPNLSRI